MKHYHLSAAALLALLLVGVSSMLQASPLTVDLNAGIKKYIPGGAAPTNYAFSGNGVEVSWETGKSKYIELVFNRPLPLPQRRRSELGDRQIEIHRAGVQPPAPPA